MKKLSFYLGSLLICLTLNLFMTDSKCYAQDEKPNITSTQVEFDFGTIKEVNGKVTHKFQIKNTGKTPLVITRVTASCGCTTPDFDKEPIAPGKTSYVTVTYNPAGRPGPFFKTIAVYSNAKNAVYLLKIKGKVE